MRARTDRPLRCDQVARELPNRVGMVAGGMGAPGEAEQVCRDLHELLEGDYRLAFKPWAGADAQPHRPRVPDARAAGATEPAAGTPFVGRAIATKFATVCKVCRTPLAAGAEVIWQQGVGCACVGCGEVAA